MKPFKRLPNPFLVVQTGPRSVVVAYKPVELVVRVQIPSWALIGTSGGAEELGGIFNPSVGHL